MNCANHNDAPAVAYCRTCGKPLCSVCAKDVRGVIYCEDCLASHVAGTAPPPGLTAAPIEPPSGTPSPGLALALGFIPGVGAMYNGEFAKGFVHVLIFATLIWMSDHVSSAFGIAIAAFYIYMPIEAYKTAKAREAGLPAPDPLGLNNLFRPAAPVSVAPPGGSGATMVPGTPEPVTVQPPAQDESRSRAPVGAFVLIALGVIFLLNEFGLFNFNWDRFWPLILIAVGLAMLFRRQRRSW